MLIQFIVHNAVNQKSLNKTYHSLAACQFLPLYIRAPEQSMCPKRKKKK